MTNLVWIGLFLPLVGFLILLFSSDYINRTLTGLIACTTVLISFICFSTLLYTSDSQFTLILYDWLPVKNMNAQFSVHLDELSFLMTLIITGVGFLIHVYANGYMEHDEDYARFFACMNFFIFMMLLLVLANDLLLLFVGWEGVGLASYLLIGFWYSRPAAASAATKAFVINRIGDWGFLLGLLLTFHLFGTSNILEISTRAVAEYPVGAPVLTLLTLLYFIGSIGKSAQIPLHVWLPDAMEGPTPVSALIHAATMVTAGVYLVVRLHPIFLAAPTTLNIVGVIGGATALFAAVCALSQTDLKRVLAYSTVSQLGYMFLACGVGAFYAAMFHLTTHAFVKALLFLSAGNVVHMMHGSPNMEKMGGLSKQFPLTHILFLIGALALSGLPPLAAFFSKDLILEQEYETGHTILFTIGVITAGLTAFYLMRAYFLTFTGAPRLEEKVLKAVKEASRIMLLPLLFLALLSIFGGFLGFAINKTPILEAFLAKEGITLAHNQVSTGFHFTWEMWLSVAVAVTGLIVAAILYTRYTDRLGKPIALFKNSFYIDDLYWNLFAEPLKRLSLFIDRFLEPKIFEGSIQTVAQTANRGARILQQVQSGQIRSYVAWMAIGMVLMIVYFIF